MLLALKQPTHEDDENESGQRPHQRAQQAVANALVDEPEASREHESGGHSVGRPEPSPGEILYEDERQRPYPCRHSRKQREEEDFDCGRQLHTTYLRPYLSILQQASLPGARPRYRL